MGPSRGALEFKFQQASGSKPLSLTQLFLICVLFVLVSAHLMDVFSGKPHSSSVRINVTNEIILLISCKFLFGEGLMLHSIFLPQPILSLPLSLSPSLSLSLSFSLTLSLSLALSHSLSLPQLTSGETAHYIHSLFTWSIYRYV